MAIYFRIIILLFINTIWISSLSAKPNVILITIDSLRADHVGIYGYDRDTTPNLDRFANNNILFKKAYAVSSWMMPNHASLFTSLYPSKHDATHIDKQFDRKYQTIAEYLHENKYYCSAFCASDRMNSESGYGQGFDYFDDYSVKLILESLNVDFDPIDLNSCRTNDVINDVAIKWLEKNTHSPFFMFLHYYDVHWDYLPQEPYKSMFNPGYEGEISGKLISKEPLYSNPPSQKDIEQIVALYDGEVRQTDNDLGELITYFEKSKILDNSIVIIMGGSGEQLYEHGHTSHHGLYEELIHVPLIISVPDKISGVSESLISQIDIFPTIAEFLGLAIPSECQGISYVKTLNGDLKYRGRSYVVAEYSGGAIDDCSVILDLNNKCIFENDNLVYGFDLNKDPQELFPIKYSNFTSELSGLYQQALRLGLYIESK